jgi:uncharacterized damage-inducible protein DinB
MKDYFIRLFEYDMHANQLILKAIREAGDPEQSTQLFGHLLAAQQRWLARCVYSTAPEVDIWPKQETISFEEILADNYLEWGNFLSTITSADLEQRVNYKNSAGTAFADKMIDILTQVTNHGTHHRAQIGQQLKLAGAATLPITDYIYFIRN